MTIFLQFFSTSWGSTLVNRSFDDDFTVSLFRIYFSFDECFFLLKERTNLFEATLTLDDTSAEESETHYFLFSLLIFIDSTDQRIKF